MKKDTLIFHNEINILSNPHELSSVREFTQSSLKSIQSLDLDAKTISEIELSVNEVLINIIEHAYKGKKDQNIKIEINVFKNKISIIFFHSGSKFNPDSVQRPAFDGSQERGFGVYIINQCMDEAIYSENDKGEKSIELIKKI